MPEDVNIQEPVTPDEPIVDEADVKTPGEEQGPVPYDRFKEVNDALRQFKSLGLSPEMIVERLSRGEMLQRIAEQAEAAEPESTDTEEEAAQKERAKKLILELFPRLKNLDDMGHLLELHYEAMETEAWGSVYDILVEEGMESEASDIKALGSMIADEIKADKRLRAKYNTGKVEDAVKAGWKKLSKRFGKKEPAKVEDKRAAQIKDKQKLQELPKKIAPGGRPEASVVADDKGPKNLKEASDSAMKKLESIFG